MCLADQPSGDKARRPLVGVTQGPSRQSKSGLGKGGGSGLTGRASTMRHLSALAASGFRLRRGGHPSPGEIPLSLSEIFRPNGAGGASEPYLLHCAPMPPAPRGDP